MPEPIVHRDPGDENDYESLMPEVSVLDVASASPSGCQAPGCERRADFRLAFEGRSEELCEFCAGMRLAQDRQDREGGEGTWRTPSI